MEFVRNAWGVAGWSSERDQELRRFTILDEHIVMYRKADSTAVAQEDRGPRRLLPLSLGQRIGGDIQCGYHGMTCGCDGKCGRIPGQSNLPSSAHVESYPPHERHDIIWIWIWIWMGDKDKGPMVYRKRISEPIELERPQDLASSPTPAYVYHD